MHYTATLGSLPDKDFSFSIYADEKITTLDKTHSVLKNTFGYLTPFAIVGMLILTIVVVSAVLIRVRK